MRGFGNNRKDRTEGLIYKNTIGTYLHGPILAMNPQLADYLIKKSLGVDSLPELNDTLINQARSLLL